MPSLRRFIFLSSYLNAACILGCASSGPILIPEKHVPDVYPRCLVSAEAMEAIHLLVYLCLEAEVAPRLRPLRVQPQGQHGLADVFTFALRSQPTEPFKAPATAQHMARSSSLNKRFVVRSFFQDAQAKCSVAMHIACTGSLKQSFDQKDSHEHFVSR